MNIFLLTINAFLYIIILIYCIKRNGLVSGTVLIVSLYTLCAFFSILFYLHPYTRLAGYYYELSIIPMFYFAILTLLGVYPLIVFNDKKNVLIGCIDEKFILIGIYIFLPIQFLLYISYFPTFLEMLHSDMEIMRDNIVFGNANISENVSPLIGKIMFYYGIFRNIAVVISIYALFFVKTNRFLITLFAISSIAFPIFYSILYLMRSQIFLHLLYLSFFFVTLKSYMLKSLKKTLLNLSSLFIIPSVYFLYIITNSRFHELASWAFIKYLGETYTNFSGQLWANLRGSTDGGAYFKWLLTREGWSGLNEKWDYIYRSTKVDGHIFYGAIGQLVIEFGWAIPVVIYFTISYFSTKYFKTNNVLTLSQLLILSLYAQFMLYGMYIFPYQETSILQLFATVCLAIIFSNVDSNKIYSIRGRRMC